MEKTDRFGNSPLIDASCNGHLEVVRYLLEHGADRDKAEIDGWTSLHFAAIHYHQEIAKLLMVNGADLNARTNDGRVPIAVEMLGWHERMEWNVVRDIRKNWYCC